MGIPGASLPTQEDHKLIIRDYSISPGDSLVIEINELRQRQVPFQAQVQVSGTGEVNLPVVGWVKTSGRTIREFEGALATALRDRDVLLEAEVTVNGLFLQEATYSIFGIGVSASNESPLRAGTFPIRRPDMRILEAINLVGGLNEFVSDVYVFRYDETEGLYRRLLHEEERNLPAESPVSYEVDENGRQYGDFRQPEPDDVGAAPPGGPPERELIEAVVGAEEPGDVGTRPAFVPDDLEPAPPPPYLWVNGEFVPNPEYGAEPAEDVGSRPFPPTTDTAIPTISWARLAGDTTFRVIRIPAESLRTGDPEANVFIRAGDVIRVVSGEIGVYYVMGQVNRVGAFAFNAEPITLKAAIATAGGLSPLAWPDRCTVYRRLGQREQMIQVDLDRIFAGKDPDFYIKRGDIINVGTHPFAPFLQRIRSATLPNILSNVGYSFTYARNFADIDSFAVRSNPHNEPDRFPNLFP